MSETTSRVAYSITRLAEIMLTLDDGKIVTLVCIDRYQDGQNIGMHLVPYSPDGPRLNRVAGLFARPDAEAGIKFFDQCQLPLASAPFTGQTRDFQAYIRRAIIPLEWKRFTDEQLDGLMSIDHGAVRHSLARSI